MKVVWYALAVIGALVAVPVLVRLYHFLFCKECLERYRKTGKWSPWWSPW